MSKRMAQYEVSHLQKGGTRRTVSTHALFRTAVCEARKQARRHDRNYHVSPLQYSSRSKGGGRAVCFQRADGVVCFRTGGKGKRTKLPARKC